VVSALGISVAAMVASAVGGAGDGDDQSTVGARVAGSVTTTYSGVPVAGSVAVGGAGVTDSMRMTSVLGGERISRITGVAAGTAGTALAAAGASVVTAAGLPSAPGAGASASMAMPAA